MKNAKEALFKIILYSVMSEYLYSTLTAIIEIITVDSVNWHLWGLVDARNQTTSILKKPAKILTVTWNFCQLLDFWLTKSTVITDEKLWIHLHITNLQLENVSHFIGMFLIIKVFYLDIRLLKINHNLCLSALCLSHSKVTKT